MNGRNEVSPPPRENNGGGGDTAVLIDMSMTVKAFKDTKTGKAPGQSVVTF